MINFHVLSLFPDFFKAFTEYSIIKKGLDKNAFDINIINIRDFALNKYGQVDDMPYGGGAGMVLRPEPLFNAFNSLKIDNEDKRVIFFSPKGKKIDHNYIINLTNLKNIVLICGHYEGIDQRIIDLLVDEEISSGDYVLTGGEIPCMGLIDAVIRQLDGVIKKESLLEESFSNNVLEYRQYTRPSEFMGLKVPEVLLSGAHKEIETYRFRDSIRETLKKRPDLIDNNAFNDKIQKIINEIKKEL